MAETAQDDLELKPADAGGMFRAEMFATQVLMGYWKHLVALLVVVLVSILAWGQYHDWYRRSQRTATMEIAEKLSELPAPLPELAQRKASGTAFDASKVEAVGDDLLAVANGTSGTAAVEARIDAAEAFRLANKPDKQREALEKAGGAPGVLGFAVESELANLDLEEGKGDQAVDRLEKLRDDQSGFLAEQASIDLGLALEHVGKKDEADKVYTDFLAKFPDSPRADEVRARQERVEK